MFEDLQVPALRGARDHGKSSHAPVVSIVLAGAVALAYFLAARLGLALLTKPDGVAVFWPAAGISSGVLIAFGPPARWPVIVGVMAATIAANLLGDRDLLSAFAFAICNAGEAVIVAGVIEFNFGAAFSLGRLSHVLGLIAAATVGAAISGIGGTAGYILFHSSTATPSTIWYHWFTSDAFGIVTVAPVLIGLVSSVRDPPGRGEAVEGVVALAAVTLLSAAVIFLPREPWATAIALAALFPLLLWLASRCQPTFTATAVFIVALTIVWTTTFGIGAFGDQNFPIAERILSAQGRILAVSLCALVLAALFAERRLHERVLMQSEASLQEALTVGAVTAFDWDLRTGASRRSENAAHILGFNPGEAFGANRFLQHVHPDDRAHVKATALKVSIDEPSYAATFRYFRPDGREIWLEEIAKAEFDTEGHLARIKGLTLDITERKQAEARQDGLTAELDHRVKNVLARVAVVASQTRQNSKSMDEFAKSFDGRLQSMASAHALLSQSRWHGADLANLVRDQLAPYATEANIKIDGQSFLLSAVATQAMAMVLHELVTNAAKYGALSSADGQVSVEWTKAVDANGNAKVILLWREIGGPKVTKEPQAGFGTTLIRDLIPYELSGTVDLAFTSEGARCVIEIPLPRT